MAGQFESSCKHGQQYNGKSAGEQCEYSLTPLQVVRTVRVARYTCANPVKAGLVKAWSDWPWTRCVEWLRPAPGAAGL